MCWASRRSGRARETESISRWIMTSTSRFPVNRSLSRTVTTKFASPKSCVKCRTSIRCGSSRPIIPTGADIFTNNKFKSPPLSGVPAVRSEHGVCIRQARDGARGRDALAKRQRRDRRISRASAAPILASLELHRLDLDFGRIAADNRAALILNGWVDWADGSIVFSAPRRNRGRG